jgi:uncharacterized protein (TIGR02246 family)
MRWKCRCIASGAVVARAAVLLLCCPQQSQAQDEPATAQVLKAADAYVQAINRADAAAAAACWTTDGEFVNESTGKRVKGHKAILAALQKAVSPEMGVRAETMSSRVEIVAPDVATEEGRARFTPKAGPVEHTRFVALYVKRDGQWKIHRVWESDLPSESHYEQLADLAWMIGKWTDKKDGRETTNVCRWSKNRNFITRTFKVSDDKGVVITGTEIIGWDASEERIRSWTFDSTGGFAKGLWRFQEGEWKPSAVEDIEPADLAKHQEALKGLDWLIGNWVVRGEDETVESTCKWSENKTFIVQRFKATVKGHVEQEGIRAMGWDPKQKRIRSWVFDTDGGFGEATWSRDGDRWVANTRHVLPDGRLASSITICRKTDENTFIWQRISQEIGGEMLPNTDEVKVVRTPTAK